MTKEDLKSKFEDSFDAHSHASEGGMGPDVTDWRGMWRSFEPAILEYAKQQSIAFMQWNSRMYTMGIDRQADQWFDHKGECVAVSTEELYGQFVASQNNPESFYYIGNQQQNKP